MKYILFLFLFFTACQSSENSNETTTSKPKVSFATSLKADAKKLDQLYLYSKQSGEGYVKLVHFGNNEQHLGSFDNNPNDSEFNFRISESLSSTLMKSEKYKDYYLNIVNDSNEKNLKIKVRYEYLKKDTIINLKENNIIPLRNFSNPKQSKITVEVLHPDFKLENHSFEYYYTGLIISDKTELNSSIYFEKDSKTITIFKYLESNETKKIRSYEIF